MGVFGFCGEDPTLKTAQEALEELQKTGLVTPEELGEQEPKSTLPSETDKGLSAGNIVAIGLGMAAVGGGLALALGQDDDDDAPATSVPNPEDTSPPTVRADPTENSSLDCTGGNILFSFSEAMANVGEALPVNGGSIRQGWRGDRVYEVSWSSDESICTAFSDITITLSGFKDVSGNLLADPTSFTYSAGEREAQQTDSSL
ncbi:MAG: hypothetical protein D3904_18120 [Candidatus Electrothrix sp. EH2]|nr:hypothetical protein [Candidatus Electrothrix sp. EH2]